MRRAHGYLTAANLNRATRLLEDFSAEMRDIIVSADTSGQPSVQFVGMLRHVQFMIGELRNETRFLVMTNEGALRK